MKVIITGGAGFIGSHVAAICKERGWHTLVIDDLSGGFIHNIPGGVFFSHASITDPRVEQVIEEFKPDYVFHLAAYAAEGLSHHIPTFNYVNNLVGTSRVLNASFRAGVKHFVFTSSIATYGHPPSDRPFTEIDVQVPIDPYGIAKRACEEQIAVFKNIHPGFNYTIFRPHNVFGPNQNISDPYRNVVGIFMRQCLEKKQLTIFGDGTQTRSFSYIDVVAHAIVDSVTNEAAIDKTFNIGGDEPMSVGDLATHVSSILDTGLSINYLPPRHEALHAHCDHTLARTVFRDVYDRYSVDIVPGLKRMADWVKTTPVPKATPCPSEIEISHGLPPSWK